MKRSLCFETESLKTLFLKCSHEENSVFTFNELVETISGVKCPQQLFAPPLEYTVSLLRQSLILNEEHVNYCFSLLPDTPKNSEIRNTLLNHIKTTGSEDWTSWVWNAIGQLKERKVSLTFSPHWIFVKDTPSTYLFSEFAKAFAYARGVETTTTQSFGKSLQAPNLSNQKGQIIYLSNADGLKALGDQIFLALKKAPQVAVPFHGSLEEKTFLHLYLQSKGITSSLDASPPIELSFFYKVRTCSDLSLVRRFQIWHEYKGASNRTLLNSDPQEILDLLHTTEKISDDEKLLLKNLLEKTETFPPIEFSSALNQILWFPWLGIPNPDLPVLAYAGKTLFEFDLSPISLTVSELERLSHEGFPVPRPSEIREARLNVFLELLTQGALIYTSLDPEQIELLNPLEPFVPLSPSDPLGPLDPVNLAPTLNFSIRLPRHSFSATQLETYATCPTKYLFGNRLKLRKEPNGMENLALLHGQLTHRTLELYFSCESQQKEEEFFLKFYEEAQKEIVPFLDPSHPLSRSLRLQFRSTIPTLLTLESTLDTLFGKHTPQYFEKSFEIEIDSRVFRGKIDRIDRLSDGSLLILDYKTGTIDFTPDHIRQGHHFQALLYLLGTEALFKDPVAGMLFYDLKNQEVRRGILIEERVSKEAKKGITRGHTIPYEKYQALVATGTEQIRFLCEKIESSYFSPSPSPDHCSYCDFSTFCRSAHALL